jgi:protocatechuate 3,4-dioxygenase beta subunit
VSYSSAPDFTGFASSTARGGPGFQAGGDGTVAFIDTSEPAGHLHVHTRWSPGAGRAGRFGAITVEPGARIDMLGVSSLGAGRVVVSAGARIVADGTGYAGGWFGPGEGPGGGGSKRASAGGGGHGGAGGPGTTVDGGAAYGEAEAPQTMGSGGGANGDGYPSDGRGGAGGGAIRIFARELLRVDGAISANGLPGGGEEQGGGAGGSIWITTGHVEGSGTIAAHGGAGVTTGGGGAGGRIAIDTCDQSSFGGAADVTGAGNGEAGSLVSGDCVGQAGAPGDVSIAIDPNGDGTTVRLDWSGYDTLENGGDIDFFTVYKSNRAFGNVAAATSIAVVPGWQVTHFVTGLTRNEAVHFAVVATDFGGESDPDVPSAETSPVDVVAPGVPTALATDSFADSLRLLWSPPAGADDVALYRVRVGNEAPQDVPVTAPREFLAEGLTPASSYTLHVRAIDGDGNVGPEASITGVTWLANPAAVTAHPFSSRVRLEWTGSEPGALVQAYRVYAATSPFSSVEGLTPAVEASAAARSASVTGLTNDTPYFLAVTAVNTSGGEYPTVTTVQATPRADVFGPVLSSPTLGGAPLIAGATADRDVALAVQAQDESLVGRVEFLLDDGSGADPRLIDTAVSATDRFESLWRILPFADGPYTLVLRAIDTLGNASELRFAVTVALAPPAPPVFTSPANGFRTGDDTVRLEGTAAPGSRVTVSRGGVAIGDPLTADFQGRFAVTAPLDAGDNSFSAVAEQSDGRGGPSAATAPLLVVFDTSIPDSPIGLTARARENGRIRLTWSAPLGGTAAGYVVYRSTASFSDVSTATRVNTSAVVDPVLEDLPGPDGRYVYRVVAVNDVGTAGPLSNEASASSDATAPRALSLTYDTTGEEDPASHRVAPGVVTLALTVSEPLVADPFLSLAITDPATGQGLGLPISVQLQRTGDTSYVGSFAIEPSTPSGRALFIFSARDIAGNRGTAIDAAEMLVVDTVGPRVTSLTVTPPAPIQNDAGAPVEIEATLAFDSAPEGTPALFATLFGSGHIDDPIASFAPTDASRLTWRGQYPLPADAGETAENLAFTLTAVDDLGNPSPSLPAPNSFQVYQGDLPALTAPTSFSAIPLPGGRVALSWSAVPGAAGYQLYRSPTPGAEVEAHGEPVIGTSFTDSTTVDGSYEYTIRTVREASGRIALSEPAASKFVDTDSQPPAAPANLALSAVPRGIEATWSPAAGDANSYRLYRADRAPGVALDPTGLTPILSNIDSEAIIDTSPSPAEHAYAATAVDDVGNESPPSNTAYLNPVLPVATLEVVRDRDAKPRISWTHPSSAIDRFRLTLGTGPGAAVLQDGAATSFEDTAWTSGERLYAVTAIASDGSESATRTILLPAVEFAPAAEAQIARGVFSRLDYEVTNASAAALDDVTVTTVVRGRTASSLTTDVAANATAAPSVVVGGHPDLAATETVESTLTIEPLQLGQGVGERVRIVREDSIPVGDDTLVLRLDTEELRRGAIGNVTFSIDNTSEVETEVVVAEAGNQPSGEVRILLYDGDDNLLSTKAVQIAPIVEQVLSIGTGQAVARVAPGATWTSPSVEIDVPIAAPDVVRLALEIDAFHYRRGSPQAASIPGRGTSREASVVETPYVGEVSEISPLDSFGDEPIVIRGRAVDRAGAPLASVPLDLVLRVRGFERKIAVYTGDAGIFEYAFEPGQNDGGEYEVFALYPSQLDRPAQCGTPENRVLCEFTIRSLTVTPDRYRVNVPRNYVADLAFTIAAGGDEATDVAFEYREQDQALGQFPPDVRIELPEPITVAAGERRTVTVRFWGESNAETLDAGIVVLAIKSNETGDAPHVTIPVTYEFSEATPSLSFSPSILETGARWVSTAQVDPDDPDAQSIQTDVQSEIVRIRNNGLAALEDVTIELQVVPTEPPPSGTSSCEQDAPLPESMKWLYLSTQPSLGRIDVGESRELEIGAAPTDSVPAAEYEFRLRARAANHPARCMPIIVSVREQGEGSVLVHVSDIYTATLDEFGNPVRGVYQASVRVLAEDFDEEARGTTDEDGEVEIGGLSPGDYLIRVSAPDHADASTRVRIRPETVTTADVFLTNNLVTVEWSVREITLEDRYEIVLTATYKTDVPVAVVVLEPPSIALPSLKRGEVFSGELTLTNYGLIQAEEVRASLPGADERARFDFDATIPEVLGPRERVVIPYRITALVDFDPVGASAASGGQDQGVCTYSRNLTVTGQSRCINGQIVPANTCSHWVYSRSCPGGYPSSPGGVVGGGAGGSDGGDAGISFAPPSVSVPGTTSCLPGSPCSSWRGNP